MSDLTLGGRLRLARIESGLTISELADRVGKRRETVSAWENDHQDCGAKMLRRVAVELNTSADWLLFGKERYSPPPDVADDGDSPPAREISLADWPMPDEAKVLVPAAVG